MVKEDVSRSDIMKMLILMITEMKKLKEMKKRKRSEFNINFMFFKNSYYLLAFLITWEGI